MISKLFVKHCKQNILKYTVALSAAVHLTAFNLFPSWQASSLPDREKVIKIKSVLQTKEKPEEKSFPEFQKKIEPEMTRKDKTSERIRPNYRPESAIIKSAKVALPLSTTRNPVRIRNSKNILNSMKSFQHPNPYPVSKYKSMIQFEIPKPIRPTSRLNPEASQQRESPVPLSKLARISEDTVDALNRLNQENSFQPAPRNTQTSSGATVVNSSVQIMSQVTLTANNISPSPAVSTFNGKISLPETAAVQKLLPVEMEKISLDHQRVSEINNFEKAGLKSLRGRGQRKRPQARVPESHGSERVAQNQAAIAGSGNHSPSLLKNTRLFQMASIPADFSEEILSHDEEVRNRAPQKAASLGGTSEVSEALLGKIKKGFSSQVWGRIARFKHYPRIARDRGFEGQPVVAFTLGISGDLQELAIVNPSPYKLLNEAALDAVKSGSPYPPIPELLNMQSIKFKLPISFKLEER